jgi:hypothetical protein
MRSDLLRFNGAVERDAAIDAGMKGHAGELGVIAHQWFEVMRKCGDEVRELFMTAVRQLVWAMRRSAVSTSSLPTLTWAANDCPVPQRVLPVSGHLADVLSSRTLS